MNPQLFVPLEVVAGFKLLKRLTTDVDLIKKVLRNSKNIELDESGDQCMIRPACAVAQRSTIILREIAKDVPEEEIRNIFPNRGNIVACHADIGDTWFVTFASEDECKRAYDYVQTATFRDKAIKARIKSENLLKSFIPNSGGEPAANHPSLGSLPKGFPGFMPQMPIPMPYPFLMSRHPPFPQPYLQDFQGMGHLDGRGYRGRGRGPPFPGRGPHGRAGRSGPGTPPVKPATPKLGPQDFPPLPSSSTPTTGYDREFTKWAKQDIIDVLTGLQKEDVPKPTALPANCPAVASAQVKELELTRSVEAPATADAAKKTFLDAVITKEDIKPPEAKARRNSQKRPEQQQQQHHNEQRGRSQDTTGRGNGRQGRGGGRGQKRGHNGPAAEEPVVNA